jgi:hypothetical protein
VLPTNPLITGEKLVAMLPNIKASLVKGCVRKLPERVCVVANEMCRAENLIIGADHLITEGTFGFP